MHAAGTEPSAWQRASLHCCCWSHLCTCLRVDGTPHACRVLPLVPAAWKVTHWSASSGDALAAAVHCTRGTALTALPCTRGSCSSRLRLDGSTTFGRSAHARLPAPCRHAHPTARVTVLPCACCDSPLLPCPTRCTAMPHLVYCPASPGVPLCVAQQVDVRVLNLVVCWETVARTAATVLAVFGGVRVKVKAAQYGGQRISCCLGRQREANGRQREAHSQILEAQAAA